jgi:hypothetical protein
MALRKAARLRHLGDGVEAQTFDGITAHVDAIANSSIASTQVIRGELMGSDRCSACGISVRAAAPVLGLARELVARGFDPSLPLHCYRDAVLALMIGSIGEASRLRLATHGVGFERLQEGTGGPPVRQNWKPTS